MIVKQRTITTFEDVRYDETLAYGRNDSGAYFHGEAFEPEGDVKVVAKAYLDAGVRIPDAFTEVRAVVANLL